MTKKDNENIALCGINFKKVGNKAWRSEELPDMNGKFLMMRESKKQGYVVSIRKKRGGALFKHSTSGNDLSQVVSDAIDDLVTNLKLQVDDKNKLIMAAERIKISCKTD